MSCRPPHLLILQSKKSFSDCRHQITLPKYSLAWSNEARHAHYRINGLHHSVWFEIGIVISFYIYYATLLIFCEGGYVELSTLSKCRQSKKWFNTNSIWPSKKTPHVAGTAFRRRGCGFICWIAGFSYLATPVDESSRAKEARARASESLLKIVERDTMPLYSAMPLVAQRHAE